MIYLIEGLLFLLTGFQMRLLLEKSKAFPLDDILIAIVLVTVMVIVARFAWLYPATYLPRVLSKRLRERDPSPPWQWAFVLSFTGVRGAVSLAAALALPYALPTGEGFPYRDLILFVSFGVIFITLVGLGLGLPLVVRWLGLAQAGRAEHLAEHESELAARREALAAALKSLDAITDDRELSDEVVKLLRARHEIRANQLPASLDPDTREISAEDGPDAGVDRRSGNSSASCCATARLPTDQAGSNDLDLRRQASPTASIARGRCESAGSAALAARTRRGEAEQLAAVLSRRDIEPALAGAKKAALVGEAEQERCLAERKVQPAEILLGQFTARVVEELDERGRFPFQTTLQRALAHAKLARDVIAPRLAVRQAADNHFPRPIAGLGVVEMAQIIPRIALVQFREHGIGGRQRRGHIGAGKQQTVAGRIECYRAAKRRAVRCEVGRRGICQLHLLRINLAAADPAAEADHGHENELDALARHRPAAAGQHEGDAVSVALFGHRHCQRVAENKHIADQALERGVQAVA